MAVLAVLGLMLGVHRLLTLTELGELIEIFDVPQVNAHRVAASPRACTSQLPPIDRRISPPHPGDSSARPASRRSFTPSCRDTAIRECRLAPLARD